ncbi:MAG: hypothetical protein SFT90_03725 [Rickettsiales bacterium]|nr:hypothetical protein [Rickettsiales bacterium]
MKLYFTTFIFILTFFCLEVNAQELKICAKGVERCKPLKNYGEKYSRCMRIICFQDDAKNLPKNKKETISTTPEINEEEAKLEIIKICDNGKKRCEVLKNETEFYWDCMNETCRDPELSKTNPSCVEGHLACKPELDEYQACVKLNCGDAKECEKSKKFCNDGLKRYWRCVYRICLAPVDYFRKRPIKKNMAVVIQDKKTGKAKKLKIKTRKPSLSGASIGKLNPPKGIDAEEWVRDIPTEFLITGNPSKYMKCLNPEAVMECRTRDVRSCGCSDGKAAIMINGIPKPYKVK